MDSITTKKVSKVQLLIEDYSKSQSKNHVKFFKDLARLQKVDINYKREKGLDYEYNNQAIIYFDQKYANKFIPMVLECDFDSFYPNTLLRLNNVDSGVLKLMTTLQKYREIYKQTGQSQFEKTVKLLQCIYVGCCGQKDGQRLFTDLYLHSQIMESSRQTLRKLVDEFERTGVHVFFKQTDAVFCEIQNEEQGLQLFEIAKKIFPCKIKIHSSFYHFTQTHKYVSLQNDKAFFKGFALNCDFFGEYVDQFIRTKDPQYLLNAYDDERTLDNEVLLGSLSRAIQQFPQIQENLKDRVLIRTDRFEQGQLRRSVQFIKPETIQQFRDSQMLKFNNIVSLHEVITRDVNSFVFDIDYKKEVDMVELIDNLRLFVNTHPIVKNLFKPAFCYPAYYQTENKTSAHIRFDIGLPLNIQKEIAIEAKQKICDAIDENIYSIGKSLRIPMCSNTKKQLSTDQMIQQSLKLKSTSRLSDYLFTSSQYQTISDQYLSDCLFKQQNTINYQYDIEIENKEEICSLIKSHLRFQNIYVESVMFTKDNIGVIKIQDNDTSCVICQRKHDQIDNRTSLRFVIHHNNIVRISCFRTQTYDNDIKLPINDSAVRRNLQIQYKQLEDCNIINQPYILANKTDIYEIEPFTIDIIKSSLGSGKSEIFGQMFKKYRKVLMVSTRKVFTLQNQKRFGLKKEQIYWNQGQIDQTAIVQVESLRKIKDETIYDCVILDEFQSILQQIYKEDKNTSLQYINQLLYIIERCERVIVSDGNLIQSSVNFFKSHFPRFQLRVTENMYQTFKNNKAIIYTEFNNQVAIEYIIKTICNRYKNKQKTWAIITQKNEQMAIAEEIKRLIPTIKIKCFNGDQDSTIVDKIYKENNQKRQIINNIAFFEDENTFNEIDVCLATASITSGLNVVDDGFDFVIGLIKTNQISPQQLIQAIHRPRGLKHLELFAQSLQTKYYKNNFFDQFIKGISGDSYFNLNSPSEKFYCLCRQYINDLSVCGLRFTIHELQNMGYIVDEKEFQQQTQIQKLETPNKTIISVTKAHSAQNIIDAFMKFIPDFETDNELLQQILINYKDKPRDDLSHFRDFIELANYQIKCEFQSNGYYTMFSSKDYIYDPQIYTEVLKQYVLQGNELDYDHLTLEFTDYEHLLLFIVQYSLIVDKHGKQFLKDFFIKTHYNYKMRTKLEEFTKTEEFKDKKERYKFYRVFLQCDHRTEKTVEKCVDLIVNNNLFQYSADELSVLLQSDQYKEFSKSRDSIASYLGFYSFTKRVRQEGQLVYRLFVYDKEYIPTD